MKKFILLAILLLPVILMSGQSAPVKWYSIEEAAKLAQAVPRPIFVDAYTDWCGWCKKLDKETFSHPVIAEILNTKYYAVKFNAESKAPVTFQGRTFVNDGKLGAAHQLAYALLQGKLSYPTVAFLTAKSELITPVPGFRSAKDFEPLLVYFSGNSWQQQTYEDFMKTFKGKAE